MVKNLFNNVEFYCMNGHAEPILFTERARTDDTKDDFFACPKYMRKDDKHPDGFGEGETGCKNTLGFSVAGDILFAFNQIVQKDMDEGIMSDYEGLKFTFKNQIEVTILKYSASKIKIGILNTRAIQ